MKTVIAFGTFDILHPGHLDCFRQAKKLGERLVVVVARDATVRTMKGHLPRNDEQARLRVVQDVECVNEAVLGDTKDPFKVIEQFQPDIIALGYDQFHEFVDRLEGELTNRDIHLDIVRLKAYHPDTYKSSKM